MRVAWKRVILGTAIVVGLLLAPAWAAKDKNKNKGKGNSASDSGRPPGWDKGKKTGWGDCDVPPGQAKKQGCNGSATRGDKKHHDHDDDREDRKSVV